MSAHIARHHFSNVNWCFHIFVCIFIFIFDIEMYSFLKIDSLVFEQIMYNETLFHLISWITTFKVHCHVESVKFLKLSFMEDSLNWKELETHSVLGNIYVGCWWMRFSRAIFNNNTLFMLSRICYIHLTRVINHSNLLKNRSKVAKFEQCDKEKHLHMLQNFVIKWKLLSPWPCNEPTKVYFQTLWNITKKRIC